MKISAKESDTKRNELGKFSMKHQYLFQSRVILLKSIAMNVVHMEIMFKQNSDLIIQSKCDLKKT